MAETTTFSLGGSVHAHDIAFHPDGTLWFAGSSYLMLETVIGRVTADGSVTEYRTDPSGQGQWASSITPGPEDSMWFTEPQEHSIGRIGPAGEITPFDLGPHVSPTDIVTGPEGHLWFTDSQHGRVGRMTPNGEVELFRVGPRSWPNAITVGPDGNIWFTLSRADKIGRITPWGAHTLYPLANTTRPLNIAATAEGLWFTEGSYRSKGANRIGRITTDGRIKQYRAPARFGTRAIAAGPEGNIWFSTGPRSSAIEWISPTGKLSRRACLDEDCTLPPSSLAFAPDGTLWFGTSAQTCIYCGGGTGQMLASQPGMVGYVEG